MPARRLEHVEHAVRTESRPAGSAGRLERPVSKMRATRASGLAGLLSASRSGTVLDAFMLLKMARRPSGSTRNPSEPE